MSTLKKGDLVLTRIPAQNKKLVICQFENENGQEAFVRLEGGLVEKSSELILLAEANGSENLSELIQGNQSAIIEKLMLILNNVLPDLDHYELLKIGIAMGV